MIYIKLFENFGKSHWKLNSDDEDIFETDPYFNDKSYDDFTKSEFDTIKKLCPKNFIVKENSFKGRFHTDLPLPVISKRDLPSPSYLIELSSKSGMYNNIINIQIIKYEDEWFTVDIYYTNGDMDVWICDQFDGLIEFIQTI